VRPARGKLPRLGRLEAVKLQNAWPSEASSFTPWLAQDENIALLGECLRIELEVQNREQPVGPFRADILCRDLETGAPVLTENQLERTDHAHLGQLLTYAAGLKAVTIVWVARKFTEEHRSALEWLNDITDERFGFFGVEVGLWKIGESLCAPTFTVLVRPNSWNRAVRKAVVEGSSEGAQRRLAYWETFLRNLRLENTNVRLPKAASLGNLRFTLLGQEAWITVYTSVKGRIGVFLRAKTNQFQSLYRERRKIDQALGDEVVWSEPDEDGTWCVAVASEADAGERSLWPDQHQWLAEKLKRFLAVFETRFSP